MLRLSCDREDPLTEVVVTKIVDPETYATKCWPN